MIYISSLDKVVYATTVAKGKGLRINNQYLQSTDGAVPTNTIKINYYNVAKNQGYLTWKNSAGNSCRNVMQGSYGVTSSTYSYSSSWREVVGGTIYTETSERAYMVVYLNQYNRYLYCPYYEGGIRIRTYYADMSVSSTSTVPMMTCAGAFGTVSIQATMPLVFSPRERVSLVYTARTQTFSTKWENVGTWTKISITKFETVNEPHSANTSQAWLSLNVSYNYSGTYNDTKYTTKYKTETFTKSVSDTKYTFISSTSSSKSSTSTY